ncbi:uncharacterized protein LOC124287272 [Haliotis rubra]|uniref:uncharacterized protein LOC124287272 n=1 Tax=Haliotis rubra TaxID=36100 RepID=UPI001EE582CE|nr:uncharacterized protein LOC124287272 [Haliotis rubra]
MGVKIIIVISAVVNLAFGYNCNSEMDIAVCGASLSGFSGDLDEITQFCTDAAAAEVCVDAVIAECPNLSSSQSAQYIRMMRGQLSSLCPSPGAASSSSGCQPGYMSRIVACAGPLKSLNMDPTSDDYTESCQSAREGLNCLEEEFNNCSDKQDVRGIMSMMNPAALRGMLGNCGQKK